MAYAEYSTDVLKIPGILAAKRAEHDAAERDVRAARVRIDALTTRYRAALEHAPHDPDWSKALDALVEVHYHALQAGKDAQRLLDRLTPDIQRLEIILQDPEFQHKLHETDRLRRDTQRTAREIAIESAEANAAWEATEESAQRALPAGTKLDSETEWELCTPLKPMEVHPGTWQMSNTNHGDRVWATKLGAPVYIIMESHAYHQGDENRKGRHFYVYGIYREGEGVFRVCETELRGLPPPQRRRY